MFVSRQTNLSLAGHVTLKLDRGRWQQGMINPWQWRPRAMKKKAEAQCKRAGCEISAPFARPRSRKIRNPQQPFLSRWSARLSESSPRPEHRLRKNWRQSAR